VKNSQTFSNYTINNFELSILQRVFSYLNVIELIVIVRVCSKWKKIIDKSSGLLVAMDLSLVPRKMNSLNFMTIITKSQNLSSLVLPETMANTDTLSFLMLVPRCLKSLKLKNTNVDFATVLGNVNLENLEYLSLENHVNRKKPFNSNEIKAITEAFPKLKGMVLDGSPLDNDDVQLFVSKLPHLESLSLLKCENLTNIILGYIAKYCQKLKNLAFGGHPINYNTNLTMEGIELLCQSNIKLEGMRVEYCSRLGEKSLELVLKRFGDSLKELHIIRNCFEKCSKITDKFIQNLSYAPKLENISLVFMRSFGDRFHINLANSLHNLKVLNIRECPIQEDFTVLCEGCPQLEEVNMSGDSWVKCLTIKGLSKHKKLRVLHLGHLEHAEGHCDKGLGEFPPKGMYVESIFQDQNAFVNLRQLYLEQICGLTYWLDVRIKALRPNLEIKYTLFDRTVSLSQFIKA